MSAKKRNTPSQLLFDFTQGQFKQSCGEQLNIKSAKVVSLCGWRVASAKKGTTEEKEIVTKIVQYSKSLGW